MIAIVTGASSGIGQVFARKLTERGYTVLTVSRSQGTLQADLATEEGVAAAERMIQQTPELDLLVNNAGFGLQGYFWKADLEGQRRMHSLHVMATLRLSHAALKVMTARNIGKVINVSSVAAWSQSPGNISYCATKAWMNSFTEGLAMELRKVGSAVTVQALCPGFTRTNFHKAADFDSRKIPEWLWMSADDVVEESLRSNKVIVIPGMKYKAAAVILQHLPRFIKSRLRRPADYD